VVGGKNHGDVGSHQEAAAFDSAGVADPTAHGAVSSAPSRSTTTNSNRPATATVAATPTDRPASATDVASRMPAPAGTGTAASPATHESVTAMPIRRRGGSGSRARAMHQVAAQMSSHAGT